ncbi:MAG TPA: ligase-associated DNA damage response endonuclease PdeM [Caulobacteraceae bacterium]|nr:ligase-associated DNA damage response endonuclease PdeM [Caulobacteraceae bacterium]
MSNAQKKIVILGAPQGESEDPASGTPGAAGSSDNGCAVSEDDISFGVLAFRSSAEALHVRVAGVWATLLPSGALFIEAERTLVCGDLHLEKGSSYARRGQLLPPYDTRETLRRLAGDAARADAETVVLLGDTLHDREANGRIAPEDAETLGSIALGRTLLWIVGNHDPQGPGTLPGQTIDELKIGPLILRHEPQPGPQRGEVAGHLHPCARVVASARSVRRRCFITDGERLILPAYGAYAGGLSVRDAAFAGLFSRPPLVGAIGSRRVHAVKFAAVAAD